MLFISLEGLDGSGKTTIAKMLYKLLLEKDYDVVLTREPGGAPIAEKIRDIILDKDNINMDPWTEALLYIAARKQHLEDVIMPNIRENKIVICDRYMDSTSAYQGYARSLGFKEVQEIQSSILGSSCPDLTIFFDIEPEKTLERIYNRVDSDINRMDLEKLEFHKKVYEGYGMIISDNSERFRVVNARNSIPDVLGDCYHHVKELIEKHGYKR